VETAADPTKAADPTGPAVAPAERDKALGAGWRTSDDLAWTTSGDANGFHILVATAKSGYTWRTVATLGEQGFDVDQWIGNACVTGSGRRLVVVYAPRTFTNKAELFERGGFTAIVDLTTGRVTKLPVLSTLAYYNPGCGTGDRAVLTALNEGRTRLTEVDTARATLAAPVTVANQLTSAVPVGTQIVAAAADQLVTVDRSGHLTGFAPTTGVAHSLRPDAGGGVVFQEHSGDAARVRRVDSTRRQSPVTLAEGTLAKLGVRSAAGGRVYLTGEARVVTGLPAGVTRVRRVEGRGVLDEGRARPRTGRLRRQPQAARR
jgi:hypothetical protein